MKPLASWVAAIALVGVGALVGAVPRRSPDQAFIDRAASIHEGQLDLARLAGRKATNEEARRLAARLERQHRASLQRLLDLAARNDLIVPNRLQDPEVQRFKRLDRLKGLPFDEAYVAAMASVEASAAAVFEEEASAGKSGALRAYAAGELPMLRSQAALARRDLERPRR